jgi:hypothetical protein
LKQKVKKTCKGVERIFQSSRFSIHTSESPGVEQYLGTSASTTPAVSKPAQGLGSMSCFASAHHYSIDLAHILLVHNGADQRIELATFKRNIQPKKRNGEKMKTFMAIALALVIALSFGIATSRAQQANAGNHGTMMMSCNCAAMAKTKGAKCRMCAGKCPMCSHQGSMKGQCPNEGAH